MSTASIRLSATDDASKVIDRVRGKLTDLSRPIQGNALAGFDLGGLERVAGTLGSMLGGGGLGALLGGAGIGAGVIGLGLAGNAMAEAGAKAQALEASFETMAESAEDSASVMLQAMQTASGGTIANSDLILAANRAMSYGVANSASEMQSLIQLALTQSQKMGITATQAFNDLVTGVGRLSPMILDNLGVVVKAEDAYATYAASVGKAADALNQTEQRQAFLNAMLAAAPDSAAGATSAIESNAGSWSRWDASVKNLGESLGEMLAGPGADLLDWLNMPVTGMNAWLNPSDIQQTNTAISQTAEQIDTVLRKLDAAQGKGFRNLGLEPGAAEDMPIDITMPAPLQYEPEVLVDIQNLERAKAELKNLEDALARLRETQAQQIFGYAPDPEPWADILAMGDEWAAAQAEMAAQAEATAAAISASFDDIRKSAESQLDGLTKGLVEEMGALAALDLNDSLVSEMNDLVAAYQAAGISAETAGYLMTEWLQNTAEEARNAAANLNTFARSAGNAATASARSIGPLQAMAGALRGVARAMAEGETGSGRMSKWERVNYDLTGLTPKAGALKTSMDELGASFESAGYSAGSFGDAAGGSLDSGSGIAGMVSGLLGGAMDVGVGVDTSAFLPREDAINEDARRLADVMVNGFGSPWASYFQSEFPALFSEMTTGGDIQAGAARLLQEFEAGLRPELINQDAVKDRVKAMLVGDANMAALAAEITAELEAELAGADPAQIAGMVNGALGLADTGAGAGIEEELNNEAFLGKLSGAGQKGGANWGKSFIAYVQANVPFELVGLLTDLVTPQVRARLAESSSAEGPVN